MLRRADLQEKKNGARIFADEADLRGLNCSVRVRLLDQVLICVLFVVSFAIEQWRGSP